jgi:RNA polymerase-interacting CarD/CdnL/TRCF family regulator
MEFKFMENAITFGELLEAVAQLSREDQQALVEVLNRRLLEQRRDEIAREIQAAMKEFESGQCREVTPDELMKEILS